MSTANMSNDVKELVRRSVAAEWPGFAARHPHLAAVLDEPAVVDGAVECLADDPEYRAAMAQATAAGLAAEALGGLVQKVVAQWLRRLLAP
jgi:hypothetical protein